MENNITETAKNAVKTISTGKLAGIIGGTFAGGVGCGIGGCKLVQWLRKKHKAKVETKEETKKEDKPAEEKKE